MNNLKQIAVLILAGGKGKRMHSKGQKVLSDLNGKPIVSYVIQLLKPLSLWQTVVLVGHRAQEVKKVLGSGLDYVLQTKRLGTGHAVKISLKSVKPNILHLLVFYGDDSAFHKLENITQLIQNHLHQKAVLSFITVFRSNPQGLGRIIRNLNGELRGIAEEKDLTEQQKSIKEVNDGCYLFNLSWLKKNINQIKKSRSGEYYLTDLCAIAIGQGETVVTHQVTEQEWMGINTIEELANAVALKQKKP